MTDDKVPEDKLEPLKSDHWFLKAILQELRGLRKDLGEMRESYAKLQRETEKLRKAAIETIKGPGKKPAPSSSK